MPIDINQLREGRGGNPEQWREHCRRRFQDPAIIDRIIELDTEWRGLVSAIDVARREVGKAGKAVAAKKKAKENADAEIEEMKQLKEKVPPLEAKLKNVEATRDSLVNKVGNEVHPDVPVSKNEDDNVVVRTWGDHKLKAEVADILHHHELLWMIGGYEPERGARAAGHRAYYLTGPALMLNLALIQYGLRFLSKKQYVPVQPPYFMNKDVMAGVAQLEDFDEQLYKVSGEGDDEKYLIATSEQPICGYHRGEWLVPKDLPLRYAGYSTCFRKEAGAHGRDTWGIFRVHQFEKVEQFMITEPEKSWEAHEEMIRTAEEFYQALGLSYRVIDIVSGELNNAAARKYDLEAWFPAFGEYRELVSSSNCTDYQSRGMGIRLGTNKAAGTEKSFVHMLNATLCATTRTISCILENYQTPEGVRVPEVLQPFVGTDFFPFVRDKPQNLTKNKMMRAAAKKEKQMAASGEAGAGAAAASAAGEPKKAASMAKSAGVAAASHKETKSSAKVKDQQPSKPASAKGKAQTCSKPAGRQGATALPAGTRASLSNEAGWSALDTVLSRQSYVAGFSPSAEDDICFKIAVAALAQRDQSAPDAQRLPNAARWFRHMQSFSADERAAFPLTRAQLLNASADARVSTMFTA